MSFKAGHPAFFIVLFFVTFSFIAHDMRTAMRRLPLTSTIHRLTRLLTVSLCALWLAGCAALQGASDPAHRVGSLRLIGEQRIALNQEFRGTVIGGLSGIDYDAATDTWVAESDDRSEVSPARFYTLRLRYDLNGFHQASVEDVTFLRQADGSLYPGVKEVARLGGEVPDIESIRVDPQDGSLWYSSEGSRPLGMSPFVRQARRDGRHLANFPVGAMFDIHPDREWGPRNNLSFEGLSFSPDGNSLWLGMEEPLYQDGPVASVEHGALARITRYGRDGAMLAQYAYPLDPIPHAPGGKYADNGLSEILAVDDTRLLVLERAGIQGKDGIFSFHIRLYEMDVAQASDTRQLVSLRDADRLAPANKRLVLDFNRPALLEKVDNLEGMSWGPKLANGHDSLVFVSDNNFTPSQVTQLLVFEVLPP
ncbi:MAG: hypothetical protein GAK35_02927 [Herbaspirillum frisingense]|uniref:Phytase-like domain-containing protein n=1 Tax=Herbaspirillum frisingense TaxID=92645 RepID=A0A7V8JTB1_9BURK|nr:MAG: hypothetical protein GAK35_02927 [Herbaspirillum frisingense]